MAGLHGAARAAKNQKLIFEKIKKRPGALPLVWDFQVGEVGVDDGEGFLSN